MGGNDTRVTDQPNTGGGGCGTMTNQLMYLQQVVLTKIMRNASAWPFLEPVDAVKLNIPNYFDIIKHPMDLSTIKARLDSNAYTKAEECMNDFGLMFNNCYVYNRDGPFVELAESLESLFYKLLDGMPKPEVPISELASSVTFCEQSLGSTGNLGAVDKAFVTGQSNLDKCGMLDISRAGDAINSPSAGKKLPLSFNADLCFSNVGGVSKNSGEDFRQYGKTQPLVSVMGQPLPGRSSSIPVIQGTSLNRYTKPHDKGTVDSGVTLAAWNRTARLGVPGVVSGKPMSYETKMKLRSDVVNLSANQITGLTNFLCSIDRKFDAMQNNNRDEIELDFEEMEPTVLRQMEAFAQACITNSIDLRRFGVELAVPKRKKESKGVKTMSYERVKQLFLDIQKLKGDQLRQVAYIVMTHEPHHRQGCEMTEVDDIEFAVDQQKPETLRELEAFVGECLRETKGTLTSEAPPVPVAMTNGHKY